MCRVLRVLLIHQNSGEIGIEIAVPTTASGLQGEKPLVDRIGWMGEVGKLDLYLRKKDWL